MVPSAVTLCAYVRAGMCVCIVVVAAVLVVEVVIVVVVVVAVVVAAAAVVAVVVRYTKMYMHAVLSYVHVHGRICMHANARIWARECYIDNVCVQASFLWAYLRHVADNHTHA